MSTQKQIRNPEIAIILTDPSKKIIWVNRAFSILTSYDIQDVLEKHPNLQMGQDTEPELVEYIQKLLALNVSSTENTINYQREGVKHSCYLTMHPIFDLQEKLIAFIGLEIDQEKIKAKTNDDLIPRPKYNSSNLSKVKSIKIYKALMRIFREDEVYKNPHCSLPMLSEKLGTNTKYLSQVINKETGMKFRDFLNTYRINYFKQLIKAGKHRCFSIEGLSGECGFKNKMSFYNAVKKMTNYSPSQLIAHINS